MYDLVKLCDINASALSLFTCIWISCVESIRSVNLSLNNNSINDNIKNNNNKNEKESFCCCFFCFV